MHTGSLGYGLIIVAEDGFKASISKIIKLEMRSLVKLIFAHNFDPQVTSLLHT